MLSVHELSNNAVLLIERDRAKHDDALLTIVDKIWREAQRKNSRLFDGSILSCISDSSNKITSVIDNYKFFFSKKSHPGLLEKIQIMPIAVSGILECKDGFVFGKRAKFTTQDAELWELVPSGGLDASITNNLNIYDFKQQLLTELYEEMGINPDMLRTITPFCYVIDHEASVLDIGVYMYSDASQDTINHCFTTVRSFEYESIIFIPRSIIIDFIAMERQNISSISVAIMEFFLKKR
ncbi:MULTISPECIES: hypothetical protein [Aeromonas]|uniref:hypothetical protein n=1 Tax=Aeromonas TaxID=642 RepID=UPI000C78E57E|nr:hypothetical protein [Aeromonas veronii]AYK18591.1 hypothetical protein C0073_012605 [Aeromonas veronii]MCR3963991.1 hypothetical protein [Aeromonas veronii]